MADYKIRFNVPPFTGKEMDYIKQAVDNMKICGDGEFTKKELNSDSTCRWTKAALQQIDAIVKPEPEPEP